jgi:23S rRNA (pseudouridine1915-N3)-methyltransferase
MHLIAVGRIRNRPEAALFDRYAARLRPNLTVTEVPEARGSPPEIKRREGAALIAALPREAFAVALDQGGQILGSELLAVRLEQWLSLGKPLCFIIGGAEGLDAQVVQRCDFVLSLGLMTWPHFLVRTMLAEQLYRAHAIAAGHPYHRSGRPRD